MELFKSRSACRECKRKDKLITHIMCRSCMYGGMGVYSLTGHSAFVLNDKVVVKWYK